MRFKSFHHPCKLAKAISPGCQPTLELQPTLGEGKGMGSAAQRERRVFGVGNLGYICTGTKAEDCAQLITPKAFITHSCAPGPFCLSNYGVSTA